MPRGSHEQEAKSKLAYVHRESESQEIWKIKNLFYSLGKWLQANRRCFGLVSDFLGSYCLKSVWKEGKTKQNKTESF